MKSIKEYKKGQWLIRKWASKYGGEIDFVMFKFNVSTKYKFEFSKFYRIKNNKVQDIMPPIKTLKLFCIEYFDSRMSIQFRLATKKEIKKYAVIIINN